MVGKLAVGLLASKKRPGEGNFKLNIHFQPYAYANAKYNPCARSLQPMVALYTASR
jgi:hypothetical protein